MSKLYLVVDHNGRQNGYVFGIFEDLEKARLAAANTPAHVTIYELKAVAK